MGAPSETAQTIHPVILCGGSGTRLWPLSREAYPKQLLSLAGARSLLQDTVARAQGPRFAPPLMLCNAEHRFVIAEQLRTLGITPRDIVLEPAGRNTAPAIAIAALLLAQGDSGEDPLMLVLPSDHTIADTAGFHLAIDRAAAAASDGALVTFGIKPTHPETGYGYIERGNQTGRRGCFEVQRFVEKPDLETAQSYLDHGRFDWNSGMFMFSARHLLDEMERRASEMLAACRAALAGASRDLDFLRLDAPPFEAIKGESIDYAVMEHAQNVNVVPVDIGWSDIGSWSALWDIGEKDGDGDVSLGDVLAIDVKNSYLRSEGPLVAALGVEDLVVVATDDAILVTHKDRAQDIRLLVDRLKADGRTESLLHLRVYRPWGFYQTVHEGERFQVKRITVNPGASLSLQLHHHRAEHWVVVNGIAEVVRGEDTLRLAENESVYIPHNTKHRLANPGRVPLNLIEVQSGGYLGEDDIVRFDDVYGRAEGAEGSNSDRG